MRTDYADMPYCERRDHLAVYALSISLFFSVFKISILPTGVMQLIKLVALAYILLTCFRNFSKIRGFISVGVFLGTTVVCAALNNGSFGASFNLAILFAIQVFCILSASVSIFRYKIESLKGLRIFLGILFTASLFNDISILTVSSIGSGSIYLLGNKFVLGYIHLIIFGLYATVLQVKKGYVKYNAGILFLYGVYSLALMAYLKASTCLLAILFTMLFYYVMPPKSGRIIKGNTGVLLLVGASVAFFGIITLLDLPIIRYFIQEVLGKSLTLTGRLQIYEMLGGLVDERLYCGWGFNSDIVSYVVGYGNAQNGIMQVIVESGLIGGFFFLNATRNLIPVDCEDYKGLCAVFVGVVVLSVSEIPFDETYFLFLGAFACLSARGCTRFIHRKDKLVNGKRE